MEAQTPHQPTPPPLSSVLLPPPPAHLNYPDSVDSSPRSRHTDSWDEPYPPPTTTKLRLMVSYGGHIAPRPHDKSLSYIGGDTRIIVVDRHTSLSELTTRLSKAVPNGRQFTIKYQLPSEDLDSLISVTTDEDIDNMIDEYDRTAAASNSSSSKPSRIRLFLFPNSAQTIGPDVSSLGSGKSDDWFVNALNGTAGLFDRVLSDSASVNCLLGLDDEVAVAAVAGNNSNNNLVSGPGDSPAVKVGGNGKNLKQQQAQDVQSVPDSPMLETNSSFGSSSSSPSAVANLPPIKVHVGDAGGSCNPGVRVQDQKVMGIEEQFGQLGVGSVEQKQYEGFVGLSSPPAVAANVSAEPVMTAGVRINSATVVAGEYPNHVASDDDTSEPVRYGKSPRMSQSPTQSQSQPQAIAVPPEVQQKSTCVTDLPSTDSVSSDTNLSKSMPPPKPAIYQDQIQIQSGTPQVPNTSVDPKLNVSDTHGWVQLQQLVPEPGYVLQHQFEQQHQVGQQHQFGQLQQQQQQAQQQPQFIPGMHFIHHNPTGPVPITAYYPVYPSQQHPTSQHHHQLDQQYPVYFVPARQAQAYNLSVQYPNIGESATTVASSQPQNPPNPAVLVPPSAAYNTMRSTPLPKSEMTAAGTYRTAPTGTPQLVQVPAGQHQQQYVAYSQIHHPSQSMAPTSAAPANYTNDYVDPAHAQIFYTQHLAPAMPSQYQTMTAAAAVVPEVSAQHPPSESMKQQVRTSQPL